jgi:hypothetical protein
MGIRCYSECFYGITFTYEQIKNLEFFPEEWVQAQEIDTDESDLWFESSSRYFDCEEEDMLYHVGLKILKDTTLQHLIDNKDKIVKLLKEYCVKNNLQYSEPHIHSFADVM